MNGYDSSRLWDTAFAAQAIARAPLNERSRGVLDAAFAYLEANQVLEDVPERERCFRHASKGGWPFSSRAHGWPISDCTAEGLKACLAIEAATGKSLPRWRLDAALELMLSLQNADGGWATYELTRGPAWLEALNASDCFRDIMIDYSYVECTSACMQALHAYRQRFARCPRRAHRARHSERPALPARHSSGSMALGKGPGACASRTGPGSEFWGSKPQELPTALPSSSAPASFCAPIKRADGSWGESAESCAKRYYVPTAQGQAVMTAWATLALIAAGHGKSAAVTRAVDFLRRRQRDDGSFPARGHRRRVQQDVRHSLRQLPEDLPALGAGRGRERCARSPPSDFRELRGDALS